MSPDEMREHEQQKDPLKEDALDENDEAFHLLHAEEDENLGDLLSFDEEDEELFREAMKNYRVETLEWAERRSATMAVPQAPRPLAWWKRVPAPALAAVALLALVSAAAVRHHEMASVTGETAAFVLPSSQTLATDNLLLSSVDAALDQDAAPTEQDLGLAPRVPGSASAKHILSSAQGGNAR